MIIPSFADRLSTASELFREEAGALIDVGVPYYDDRVHTIAAKAIQACAPELSLVHGNRLVVESMKGLSLRDDDEDPYASFNGVHVEGVLERVSIQQIIEFTRIDAEEIRYTDVDLFAVIAPKYTQPDPVDIVFGKELYVPFGELTDAAIIEN